MQLQRLQLEQFRVYASLALEVPPAGLRIAGPNGSGKSSVIEAIGLLSTGRSPRAGTDRELIRWGSGEEYGVAPYARCTGVVVDEDLRTELTVELQADEVNGIARSTTAGTSRKRCVIDGRPVRVIDLVGRLRTVGFSPEDVAVVTGPPSGRRRLLDIAISQLDHRYLRALSRYGRVMSQRNGLLKGFARDGVRSISAAARGELAFWDDELVGAGAIVVTRREELVRRLSVFAGARYAQLAGGSSLEIAYRSNVVVGHDDMARDDDRPATRLDTLSGQREGEVATGFRARLSGRVDEEFRRGSTLIGPHRDDLALTLDGVDLATYGSRGQQRLGILAIKLAEADLMVEIGGRPPLVLLDDVLSELDPERGRLLIDTVAGLGAQAIVTATDRAALEVEALAMLPLLQSGTGALR